MSKEKKEEVIKLKDKVTVIGKKGNKYLKEGEEYSCHPKVAEHLIEKGFAVQPKSK